MKNNLKFAIAVFVFTATAFSSIKVNAYKKENGGVVCTAYGFCGKTDDGSNIDGQPHEA